MTSVILPPCRPGKAQAADPQSVGPPVLSCIVPSLCLEYLEAYLGMYVYLHIRTRIYYL